MLGETFDPDRPFLKTYHFVVAQRDKTSISLAPESFFSKPLCQLNIDLQEQIVVRARLKLSRSFLEHPTLGSQATSAAEAFIRDIFPKNSEPKYEAWVGQQNPNWLNSSDKIEFDEYSLSSRVSQNWIQLDGASHHSKDSSWWRRITGR